MLPKPKAKVTRKGGLKRGTELIIFRGRMPEYIAPTVKDGKQWIVKYFAEGLYSCLDEDGRHYLFNVLGELLPNEILEEARHWKNSNDAGATLKKYHIETRVIN
jgi:hypothetical protein